MIKRYSIPTHLDVLPLYSEWHCEMEDGSIQIWVQANEIIDDNTKPHWIRLGDLFENAVLNQMPEISTSTLVTAYLKK